MVVSQPVDARVSSGFGASLARKLAAKGAIVAILDRDEEKGKKVIEDLVEKWAFRGIARRLETLDQLSPAFLY